MMRSQGNIRASQWTSEVVKKRENRNRFGHGVHWYTVHSREKVMAKQWGNAGACFLFAKLHGNEVEVTIRLWWAVRVIRSSGIFVFDSLSPWPKPVMQSIAHRLHKCLIWVIHQEGFEPVDID